MTLFQISVFRHSRCNELSFCESLTVVLVLSRCDITLTVQNSIASNAVDDGLNRWVYTRLSVIGYLTRDGLVLNFSIICISPYRVERMRKKLNKYSWNRIIISVCISLHLNPYITAYHAELTKSNKQHSVFNQPLQTTSHTNMSISILN